VISHPSADQIVSAIRDELTTKIKPQISDPASLVALQMIDELLANVATRAVHEVGWMREETDSITALADEYLVVVSDAELSAARTSVTAAAPNSWHLSDVRAEYTAASELLSRALELAVASGDATWVQRWREQLALRQEHELAIMGNWGFAGRG
jgi:hypothetical protein